MPRRLLLIQHGCQETRKEWETGLPSLTCTAGRGGTRRGTYLRRCHVSWTSTPPFGRHRRTASASMRAWNGVTRARGGFPLLPRVEQGRDAYPVGQLEIGAASATAASSCRESRALEMMEHIQVGTGLAESS